MTSENASLAGHPSALGLAIREHRCFDHLHGGFTPRVHLGEIAGAWIHSPTIHPGCGCADTGRAGRRAVERPASCGRAFAINTRAWCHRSWKVQFLVSVLSVCCVCTPSRRHQSDKTTSARRVFAINARAQPKLLCTWIIYVNTWYKLVE